MTSSILTNNGAMTALMTLRGIGQDLKTSQDRVSSGLAVADASHNSSVFATAQIMRSDIGSYDVIARTLSVSSTNLGLAMASAEKIAEQIDTIRQKLTEAFTTEAESQRVQDDVTQALGQIETIAASASFKGINMINNAEERKFLASVDRTGSTLAANNINVKGVNLTTKGTGALSALAGFRVVGGTTATEATFTGDSSAAAVTATVAKLDFAGFAADQLFGAGNGGRLVFYSAGQRVEAVVNAGDNAIQIAAAAVNAINVPHTAPGLDTDGILLAGANGVPASPTGANAIGPTLVRAAGADDFTIAYENDTAANTGIGDYGLYLDWDASNVRSSVTDANRAAILSYSAMTGTNTKHQYGTIAGKDATVENGFRVNFTVADQEYTVNVDSNGDRSANTALTSANSVITVTNQAEFTAAVASIANVDSGFLSTAQNGFRVTFEGDAAGTVTGISVTTNTGQSSLNAKLATVIAAYDTANTAAASLGSAKNRLDGQVTFVKQISSLLTTGLGTMVDADMTVEAARLKALQTQQQLASQALSIANNAPQTLLTLFR